MICLNLSCKTTLFADDTSISKQITNRQVCELELQNDLKTIETWTEKWKVTFNPQKSDALLVSRKINRNNNTHFLFQCHDIKNVKEYCHSGLIWNNVGTWKTHLSSIINKAIKRVDMLRALKYKLNRSVLEKIYFAFIRSIFEYGYVVWDKSPRHDILFNEMEKIQRQAARIVTGTNNYSSKHLFYIETGWDKLSKRREKQRLIL